MEAPLHIRCFDSRILLRNQLILSSTAVRAVAAGEAAADMVGAAAERAAVVDMAAAGAELGAAADGAGRAEPVDVAEPAP
jgi:hypothetical protein